MDCSRTCSAATGDFWVRMGGGGQLGGQSHESEHDLAMMVSDFWENGSTGADSMCSSDSESGLSDLAHLAEIISYHKHAVDQTESEILSVVHSLLLSINEADLHFSYSGPCKDSCIRFYLVKLLRNCEYDAAVCTSKWDGCKKVPGGDHEFIDVLIHNDAGGTERFIIDIDFRSHFEIARAVESYDAVLNSLPVVYVGSLSKLMQFLQVMAEAAVTSLKQNSMPLPPWRSLAYLQAKWQSKYTRRTSPDNEIMLHRNKSSNHKQCIGRLKKLKSTLQSEIEKERLLKPINNDNNRRHRLERRRHPSFRAL